ncbi:penicillin-binding protein activator [Xylella fastidiosa]|uniref:LppC family lipoprotein n=1 Tax=Xylella fastidiosa (strain 9a5c) TaxID=160492 RepID=Q9PFV4_XYLFA|nr:penicillin-binding protein activator [Xylella fastidiosa]AAF83363.1 conserved hypothetical protein [Xylella fastidiosa 9a5c]ALQ94178.1 lppc lipoprotein [Xylella fastidiosa]ALQ96374.1 penicillin-binding protein activator [Xylella fastidiosa]ALR01267.1 lppc lipoprotein [Xylella fastidiosa]ETE34885.1 hypothetical protein B398_02145 [Xylella fastidiosa 32]
MNPRFAKIFFPLLVTILVAGCVTTSTHVFLPHKSAGLVLLEQGKPREAAQQLEAEASRASGAQHNQLLADAAFAWHEAGETARAQVLVRQVSVQQLTGESKARFVLLLGELALANRQPVRALQYFGESLSGLSPKLQIRWLLGRAAALEANGDAFGAAQQRARADQALLGKARNENQAAITRLLAGLDHGVLLTRTAALPVGDPLYHFAGRVLLSRGETLPRPLEGSVQGSVGSSQRPSADTDGYRPPSKLAVLLPLTGSLATAAAPVRDGFLAGYYAETRRRPDLDFFDTASTPAGAKAAYAKAVAAGADFVVGPLGRDEVSALFAQGQLSIPLLALNRSTGNRVSLPSGSASFSLAPEDDGVIAADYLLAQGQRNVIVIGSNDDVGRRGVQAFMDRFRARGGQVLAALGVADVPGDLGPRLRDADRADAVFLAVRGPTARVLAPQLASLGLSSKPQVGTSQLVLGTGKPEEDTLLDGIVYPTEPWSVQGVKSIPSAADVAVRLPNMRGAALRLFAFGVDAWRLSVYLERLSAGGAGGGLSGVTGTLRLDDSGNVIRMPIWATFRNGQSIPVEML